MAGHGVYARVSPFSNPGARHPGLRHTPASDATLFSHLRHAADIRRSYHPVGKRETRAGAREAARYRHKDRAMDTWQFLMTWFAVFSPWLMQLSTSVARLWRTFAGRF